MEGRQGAIPTYLGAIPTYVDSNNLDFCLRCN